MSQTITLGDYAFNRIGLGTNRLTDTPENRELLRAAVDAGVGMIDTAHTYTDGESEGTIGAALAPFADNVVVATKGGYHPGTGRPDRLRAELEQSFERLRTETIALYYLHRVDPEVPLEESLGLGCARGSFSPCAGATSIGARDGSRCDGPSRVGPSGRRSPAAPRARCRSPIGWRVRSSATSSARRVRRTTIWWSATPDRKAA